MKVGKDARLLVHLASGIGNIILATPLLQVLIRAQYTVELLVDGDYGETAQLFQHWGGLHAIHTDGLANRLNAPYDVLIPAFPPFYWNRYAKLYAGQTNALIRPPDTLFYRDEQAFYLAFALGLGCRVEVPPSTFLPIAPDLGHMIGAETLVLAPGCKTGEMAAKRWPHFPALAALFEHVVVVGTTDDMKRFDGSVMTFPDHVRSFIGQTSLAETAGILAAAGAVVANDSGLGHMAAAVGTATVLLFGPTPHTVLGQMPENVTLLRCGMACEPCWFSRKFSSCSGRIDCLKHIPVEKVATITRELLGTI